MRRLTLVLRFKFYRWRAAHCEQRFNCWHRRAAATKRLLDSYDSNATPDTYAMETAVFPPESDVSHHTGGR